MRTTPYMAVWNPVPSRFLSGLCLALCFAAAELRAAVGDTAAKIASRTAPGSASGFEGVVFASEGERVSLRLDAVPVEVFCRYLGAVHGINALASKGLSGNLNGSADGKDLGRVGEILLRRNGFDPTWIGGILVVRAVASSGTEGTPFATPQPDLPFPVDNATAYPVPDPPFIPMEPSPVEGSEAMPDPPQEGSQGGLAMESDASVPGDPSQGAQAQESEQATPAGNPVDAFPGMGPAGDMPSAIPPAQAPPQPENVPGAVVGAAAE